MRRAMIASAIVIAAVRPAAAERVNVKVVDVAGGLAYVNQGRTAGLVRGTKIKFGRVELAVVEVTEATAVVELGTTVLAVGAGGIAEITPGATTTLRVLAKPRPAEAFVGQWPDPIAPATEQDPKAVPLGAGRPSGRAHVTVIGHGFAVADRKSTDAAAEARVIATYDLLTERPFAADLDVAGRVFRSGANGGARVPVFVRTAQLRYGDPYDPRFAVGRLRYAASSVGMLDGARATARISHVEVAAFGGLAPDPISGKPDTGASRFGTEAVYDDATAPWQPRIALTGYGSTWNGAVDERRLAMVASANRDTISLDGWAEAQAFPSTNPWGAKAIEITGAGATAQWREHGMHLGGDLTFLRPERSLRLAAALPPEWLCTRQPQPGDVPDEACTGGDSWASASLSAGARGAHWAVDALGSVGRTKSVTTTFDSTGYLAGEVRFGPQRLLAGVSAGRSSFARWTAAELGVGYVMSRRFDIAARYRSELLDYVAATKATLLHSAVIDLHYAMSTSLDVAVSAIGTTGADRDAAALLTTIAWRPLP